ncbi:hypothetical protein BI364_10590 [Acidihalobacter yilgarnensis]|uniref:Uncharacterized protein n=1 Tax=Acidihalobacter yilgarnensis TaxID=2819280 RepID=A0A1D8IPH3_9GAMM|nr:DUF190 domain-containing protein [Acidihalobacter yilgarnensis]AOU98351.1 hypothetical protein BI364_10590 [Acidihalobacter yilgarnensis]
MKVTIARIYLHESANAHEKVLHYLHDDAKVRGATLFRGISGFGRSGEVHTSSLLSLSLDLPVVIEFYDSSERVAEVVAQILTMVDPSHVLTFDATAHDASNGDA